MGILNLPNELLLTIADSLLRKDLSSFFFTCRKVSSALTPQYVYDRLMILYESSGILRYLDASGDFSTRRPVNPLIDARLEFDKRGGIFDQTILHKAALVPGKLLEYLLGLEGAKAVVNARDAGGFAALHLAIHQRVTRRFKDAEPPSPHGAGVEVEESEPDDGPKISPVLQAYVECVGPFLDAGFDFDTRDNLGQTILHAAVKMTLLYDDIGMAEYLLRRGAGVIVNAQDPEGSTPMHHAVFVEPKKEQLMKLLEQYGADPEIEDNDGNTPEQKLKFWKTAFDSPDFAADFAAAIAAAGDDDDDDDVDDDDDEDDDDDNYDCGY